MILHQPSAALRDELRACFHSRACFKMGSAKRHVLHAGGYAGGYRTTVTLFLLVCYCRFRPPSVMGDQKFEHTQNITLQRILQAVINLQSIHQDLDAVDAQQVRSSATVASSF